jgi:hypothetical protein
MIAYSIAETKNKKGEEIKLLKSHNYNYSFNRTNGVFIRFGATLNDDPQYSAIGPEILDIELSSICSRACNWCYKSNTAKGKNMSYSTFVELFKKFPDTLTQAAFGIGDISANPDLFKIMQFCRDNKIIPNITINGDNLTDEYADNLARLCGAVAVSNYGFETCFNAVQKLTDRNMKQVNIHALLCEETYDKCFELMKLSKEDKRLEKLNAIVFLWLKPKGKRNKLHQLTSLDKYKKLVDYAFTNNVRIGFDSCGCNMFLRAIKDRIDYKSLEKMAEPCESCLFSGYINVDGMFFPCSFCENEINWEKGIDVLKTRHFLANIWRGKKTNEFRNKLLNNNRNCILFKIGSNE